MIAGTTSLLSRPERLLMTVEICRVFFKIIRGSARRSTFSGVDVLVWSTFSGVDVSVLEKVEMRKIARQDLLQMFLKLLYCIITGTLLKVLTIMW